MGEKKYSLPVGIFTVILCFSVVFLSLICLRTSPYRLLRPYTLQSGSKLISGQFRKSNHDSHWEILISSKDSMTFWIDQIPVTVSAYRHCVTEGKCQKPHYSDRYQNSYTSFSSQYNPVTFITWYEAVNYCRSYGGNLPSEYQWELAAGLENGKIYPWGNEEPNLSKANYDGFYQGLTPAGWLPQGTSSSGVLDLSGNVREWVLDVYQSVGNHQVDRRSPDNIYQDALNSPDGSRILKGGSSNDLSSVLQIDTVLDHWPYSPGFNRGFRCAYPAISSN